MDNIESEQPEEDRPRSLEEIVEQLGFVETPSMQATRSQIREAELRDDLAEIVRLSVSYREAGMEIVDDNRDRYEMLGLALELSIASIWRRIDDQRFLEAVESAMDLAYAYQFFGVEEDLIAMMESITTETQDKTDPSTTEG